MRIKRDSDWLRQGRGDLPAAFAFCKFSRDVSGEGMSDGFSGVASLPQSRLKDLEARFAVRGKFFSPIFLSIR